MTADVLWSCPNISGHC